MAKKTTYSCESCGTIHTKWAGKCPDCGAWNSLIEEYEVGGFGSNSGLETNNQKLKPEEGQKIEMVDLDHKIDNINRIKINIEEFDRVIGGGIVRGSAILIAGDPGIGKSTLLLQTAAAISRIDKKVFYISGEESVDQVLMRAKRLHLDKDKVKLASNTNVTNILKTLNDKNPPDIVIIDSIQTMFIDNISSTPGTISQIRACTSELTMIAKRKNITIIIVSHVTKDGQIAGPKLLEHMVDTVLYFEGDRNQQFRLLRSIKNRYGPAGEIGVFEMNELGLEEVNNPSELFLSNRNDNISGTAVFAGIEGSRPILSEIQALITPSFIPSPRRSVVGLDLNRLSMIIAVLGSRFGLNLSQKEVYLNVVGGLKISEPAVDLAMCLALISAAKDKPLPDASVAIGEVSLTGEVRMVSHIDLRVREAAKLGFKNCILSKHVLKLKIWKNIEKSISDMKMHYVEHIRDVAKLY
jgi:DNA repair protein RadA/Sms